LGVLQRIKAGFFVGAFFCLAFIFEVRFRASEIRIKKSNLPFENKEKDWFQSKKDIWVLIPFLLNFFLFFLGSFGNNKDFDI
jgi:hypothetical protein